MDKIKIDILKIIQEDRDNKCSPDYESLERRGFEKGYLRVMIKENLIGWSGCSFYITDKGDKVLREYLLIESSAKKDNIGVMFDTQIYDKMIEGDLDINLLKKNKYRYEFYITHIQVEELSNCSDKEKRAKLSLFKTEISPKIVPTESMVLGVSRFGECKFGNADILENLRRGNTRDTNDALIGETAIKKELILVTEDKKLRQKVNSNKGHAISLDEFKLCLKSEK